MAATRIRFNDPPGSGSGDVTAAANITDNRIVRGDGGAKGVQESAVTIDDSGNVSGGAWQGTAVAAAYGGTGQTSYTTGDILYASGATALSKLGAGTSGYVLTSNGAGAAPSWQVASGGTTSILFAKKSADETRTNSTTVTIDTDVQVNIAANTDYAFEAFLVFAAHATPDYKFGLVYPVGCTVDWNHTGDANGAAIAAETVVVNGVGAGLTTWKRHHVAGIIRNGANAGAFGIGWAQINLDAVNGAALRQGAWMRLQKS